MALSDKIDEASGLFFDADRFGEAIKFWPGGVHDDPGAETFTGIWDADDLAGRQQIEGEGSNLESRGGRRVRQMVLLEVPASLAYDPSRSPPDLFKRVTTGEIVALKRVVGSDAAAITLECVATRVEAARYPSRRG